MLSHPISSCNRFFFFNLGHWDSQLGCWEACCHVGNHIEYGKVAHVPCISPSFPDPAVHTRHCGVASEYKNEAFSLVKKKDKNVKCAVIEVQVLW